MNYSQRILVDIDCLFDTRLGLAKTLVPERLAELPYEVYSRRFTDIWAKIIGIDGWVEHYRKRDVNALMNAMPTSFFYGLQHRLEALLMEIQMHSPMERPVLTINLYPYTLSISEVEEFRKAFQAQYDTVNLELINESYEQLTPAKLKVAFDGFYLYNWYDWIEVNAKLFGETRMPEFVIQRPALLSSDVTDEGFETLSKATANPFAAARQYFSELLSLDTVDVALFSLDRRHWHEFCQGPSE